MGLKLQVAGEMCAPPSKATREMNSFLRDIEKVLVLRWRVNSNVGIASDRVSSVSVVSRWDLNRVLGNDIAIVCRPHCVAGAIVLLRSRKLIFIL